MLFNQNKKAWGKALTGKLDPLYLIGEENASCSVQSNACMMSI